MGRIFCECDQAFVGDAHDAPLGLHLRALRVVEIDGGLVPVEYVPLQTGTTLGNRDLREMFQQSFADSLPSLGRRDV